MGAPARPVFKSSVSGAAPTGPKEARAQAMFATWPLVQPLIAFGISTLATYATLLVALAVVVARGGAGFEVNISFALCTSSKRSALSAGVPACFIARQRDNEHHDGSATGLPSCMLDRQQTLA